ncbi:DUF6090 family protein [Gaetbulibacter aestuarii]|uniref:DUF6090 family protein n=1 Tax=Gaetbulibacter aestuarii TaxID=1502358 RepID=A0ABW7MV68_9FLAO
MKLFRKLRQKLLKENKTVGYLKYTMGEIILVVIGILIALQVNNWNEERKEHHAMIVALKSLSEDLQLDSIQINEEIKTITLDLSYLNKIRKRLSKPTATIDTLKHIARYEFVPFFDPSNEINRNTIVSLLNTGDINYFENDLKNRILKLNSQQLKLLKIMDENVSIYLNSQFNKYFLLQSESTDNLKSSIISGPLLEKYWSNLNEKDLLEVMLSKLTNKIIMDQFLISTKKQLLENTIDMLEYIHNTKLLND